MPTRPSVRRCSARARSRRAPDQGCRGSAREALGDVPLAVGGKLLRQIVSHLVVQARELPPEVAAQRSAEAAVDVATPGNDLDDPAATRLSGRRVLEKKKVLDNVGGPTAQRIASARAQIRDLLGEVREVEGEVRPGARESALLLRLQPGPGEEVVLLEIGSRPEAHAEASSSSVRSGQKSPSTWSRV
jgi:hypothetical protein